MHTHQMISTHPDVKGSVNDALIRCIDECYACAQTCISCADACLAEDMVDELKQCIRWTWTARTSAKRPAGSPRAAPARTRTSCAR
jgi:hypothetical protein